MAPGVLGRPNSTRGRIIAPPRLKPWATRPLSQIFIVTFGQSPGGMRTASVAAAAMNAITSDQAVVEAIANSRPFAHGRNGATRTRV